MVRFSLEMPGSSCTAFCILTTQGSIPRGETPEARRPGHSKQPLSQWPENLKNPLPSSEAAEKGGGGTLK